MSLFVATTIKKWESCLNLKLHGEVNIMASHEGTRLCPSRTTSAPAPWWWPGSTVEDGPSVRGAPKTCLAPVSAWPIPSPVNIWTVKQQMEDFSFFIVLGFFSVTLDFQKINTCLKKKVMVDITKGSLIHVREEEKLCRIKQHEVKNKEWENGFVTSQMVKILNF